MELEKEEDIKELGDKGLRVKCGSPSFLVLIVLCGTIWVRPRK